MALNYGLIAKKAGGWFSGFNWYKWGAILAILLAWTTAVHMRATNNAQLDCQKQKTELADKKLKDQADFTNAQSEITVIKERNSVEIREVVVDARGKLNDEVAKKPDVAGCALTDGEFVQFNRLAEKTRR